MEIRFIPDSSTLLSNVLAGAVELNIGRGLSLDQALEAREHWRDGQVQIAVVGWNAFYPQLLTPRPAVLGEVGFRQALLLSLDRQQMADSILAGLIPVAHTFLSP